MAELRVLLVDDHSVLRQGLAALINEEPARAREVNHRMRWR